MEAKKNHPFLVNNKRINQATINPQLSPVRVSEYPQKLKF